MIAATRRWFRRNRTNFVIGAGVIGAGYLAGQYVLGRLREARQRLTEDRASKENLRRRFEQNQEDCTYTVLALLPTIRDEIIGALPVEQITDQLQQERQERLKRLAASEAPSSEYPSAPPSIVDDASTASFVHASQLVEDRPKRSKAQLWQDMKINSIARALSLLYTTALLTLLTRIQLNLLGRRTYLSSVVSMASPPPTTQSSTISLEDHDGSFETVYGNDFETNRMYLTFSWWLLHKGAKNILERVMVAVKEVFGQVNIREDMSIERLSELIIEIRRKVEGSTEDERRRRSWLEYLLPPQDQELFVIHQASLSDGSDSHSPEFGNVDVDSISPSLRRLLDETADLIDSPTFALVLSHLLDAGFSHLVDVRIAGEAFKVNVSGDRITEIPDIKCKLAHILPVFCRQAHSIVVGSEALDAMASVDGSHAVPNEYLALMDRVHDLEAFAAVIYSSNFEYEVIDSPKAETASLQQSVVSLRDSQSFVLDDRKDQPAAFEQTRDFVERTLEKTRDSAQQVYKQVVEPVVETVAQQVASKPESRIERAVEVNVLDAAGPDLTKSVIPLEDDKQTDNKLEPSSADLAESAVVVEQPAAPLSQSTVVVDTPSTASLNTNELSRPAQSDLSESAVNIERPAVPEPKREQQAAPKSAQAPVQPQAVPARQAPVHAQAPAAVRQEPTQVHSPTPRQALDKPQAPLPGRTSPQITADSFPQPPRMQPQAAVQTPAQVPRPSSQVQAQSVQSQTPRQAPEQAESQPLPRTRAPAALQSSAPIQAQAQTQARTPPQVPPRLPKQEAEQATARTQARAEATSAVQAQAQTPTRTPPQVPQRLSRDVPRQSPAQSSTPAQPSTPAQSTSSSTRPLTPAQQPTQSQQSTPTQQPPQSQAASSTHTRSSSASSNFEAAWNKATKVGAKLTKKSKPKE